MATFQVPQFIEHEAKRLTFRKEGSTIMVYGQRNNRKQKA